jgi:hypothetical protein
METSGKRSRHQSGFRSANSKNAPYLLISHLTIIAKPPSTMTAASMKRPATTRTSHAHGLHATQHAHEAAKQHAEHHAGHDE